MRSRLHAAVVELPKPAPAVSGGAAPDMLSAASERCVAATPASPAHERRVADRLPSPAPLPATPAAKVPAPMTTSKRPDGRVIVAGILAALLIAAATIAWNTLFHVTASGEVVGRVACLAAPREATLESIRVRPGDSVRQGAALAAVADAELAVQIDRTSDELRTAHADLDAAAAAIVLADQTRHDDLLASRARYYELQGELLAEEARAAEFAARHARLVELLPTGAVVSEEIETLEHRQRGLADRIANLKAATAALQARVGDSTQNSASVVADTANAGGGDLVEPRLRPALAKMEQLRGELDRLRQLQASCTLRAPFAGTVVAVTGQIGEQVDAERALVEVLEDRSLEIVAYVPPTRVERFKVGRFATVEFVESGAEVECEVLHVGERYEQQPRPTAAVPHATERLLPVTLRLPAELPAGVTLRVGAEVRVPLSWSREKEG